MAKMSISVVKGRGSISHNNRDFIHDNVDPERTPDNRVYVKQPLKEAYQQLFGAEVERYNQGKKPCRQIKDYMEHIKNSKNGEKLFYENVVQVGNKQDMEIRGNREKAIEVLDEYAREFQKNNPNLHVFNMVMHLDEATPHLHIDYIPVAKGYKQGLQVRNSLDKALKEQGVDGKANKKENSTHNWQEQQKSSIEVILQEHGLERKAETGIQRKHVSVEQYKAVAEMVHNEVRRMPKQIETAPTLNKERVSVNKKDLEQLEQRAKLSLIHEKATKIVEKDIKAIKETVQSDKAAAISEYELMAREHKEALEKYRNLLREQRELNQNYRNLQQKFSDQEEELEWLREENTSLKGQLADLRRSIEEKVKEAVEPLQEQINSLMNKIKGVAETTLAVTNAVSWLKGKLKNQEEVEVCEAVEKYSKHWLHEDGFPELTEKVGSAELSKGIKGFMEEDRGEFVQKSFNMDIYLKNGVYSLFKGDKLKKSGTLQECRHEAFLIDKKEASY